MSVLVDSATETYEQGKVIKVHDDTGVFDVLLSNGTIMRLRGHANLVDWFFIALCLTLWRIAGRKKRREAKFDATFDDLLLKRQQSSKPPISGAFQGRTDESDGTTQDVEVKLEFSDDDLISGHGFDSRDGNYTIKGNYTGAGLLRWTEYYIDSNNCCASKNTKFTTTVRGTYSYKTENIDCFFRSSRGIVGDFTLRLKKVPNDAPLDGLHHRKKHG